MRYTAMIVLSHLPTSDWFHELEGSNNPQIVLRALTAASLRGEKPAATRVRAITTRLADLASPLITTRENMLDFMRVMALYESELKSLGPDQELTFLRALASNDPEISWERARVLSEFADPTAISSLLKELLASKDPVRQFHFFQCLARIPTGWSPTNEARALDWAFTTQKGWFAEFNDKGVEFPLFLQTTLEEFASRHKGPCSPPRTKLNSNRYSAAHCSALSPNAIPRACLHLYVESKTEARRIKIVQALARVRTDETAAFLRKELSASPPPLLRKAEIASLKAMPASPENEPFLKEPAPSDKPERSDEEIHKAILSASARRRRRDARAQNLRALSMQFLPRGRPNARPGRPPLRTGLDRRHVAPHARRTRRLDRLSIQASRGSLQSPGGHVERWPRTHRLHH